MDCSGIKPGQYVYIDKSGKADNTKGIPAYTTVKSVSGKVVTLSAALTKPINKNVALSFSSATLCSGQWLGSIIKPPTKLYCYYFLSRLVSPARM